MTVKPDWHVTDGESPARCPHCDRPFANERRRDIHVGDAHSDACTPAEREAYETATDEETDELFVYHLKVIGLLTALYAGLIILYMVVLSGGI